MVLGTKVLGELFEVLGLHNARLGVLVQWGLVFPIDPYSSDP